MRVPRWLARLRSDSAPAEMSFLEHLEELRGVILSCLWVFLLLSIAAWSVSGRLLDFLVRHTVGTAQFIRPLEAFTCRVKLAFLLGFAVGLPFFALRVWGFVVPGLLRHERRLVTPLVVWSTVLFLIGVGFSSLALTPQMLRVLMSFQTEVIRANLAVGFLLDFFVKMAFACGLMFQLPLVVAILSYVGVVTPSFLKSKWRHSVVIILIVAAVVTPGDGPSQLVLAAPVIVLYFISIAVSAAIHRSRRRARGGGRVGGGMAREAKGVRRAEATVLAIDIGNTQTVLGVFRGGELALFRRVTSGISRTSDELAVLVEALCREQNEAVRASRRVVIASVVPALTEGYETMAARLYDARALVVTSRVRTGVRLEVPDPSSLGADRIANAAAVAGGRLPAIVVDLGTATTFDVIRIGRRYAGGAIAPGIRTSSEELFYRAAKLAKVEIRKPARSIGRTTEESIQSGVYYGAIGTVDGIVRRLEAELGRPARVIATGGLAPLVASGSETIQEVDEALTLRGLLVIERLNRRS